jgi:cytoskeleton protein RodZ
LQKGRYGHNGRMADGVGAILRETRSRRHLDLAEVEEATKIRGRYLRAIEDEDWEVLPGEAYARAFVRTYAEHLGLDGERVVEDYRRQRGVARPGERLALSAQPPRPRRSARRWPSVPPRVLAAAVSLLLIVVVIAIGVSSGGGGEPKSPSPQPRQAVGGGTPVERPEAPAPRPSGLTLTLTATAEVWVCLLDAKEEPLVEGLILGPGSREGPFRSDSFTVAFGNGAVRMDVNGQQASIPETASPVGYSIARDGDLRELPEGERPTCT